MRSLFHQNFIKTEIFTPDLGMLYDRLFDNRQKGDYTDLIKFNAEEVEGWVIEVEKFVKTINNY